MRCVWGIYERRGEAISPQLLGDLERASTPPGWRGRSSWAEGPVAIGAAAPAEAETAPEALGELRLVGDVRLDEREELARALAAPRPPGELSDAELVLLAYRRWGLGFCRRLLGDFAFVLWDGGGRRLVAARDPMGQRLLHVGQVGDTVVVGSRPGAVAAAIGRQADLNLELLSEALRRRYPRWTEETVFRGVLRLLPGHLLTVSAAGPPRTERFRVLGEEGEEAFHRDEEYCDRLRELLAAAVASRVRDVERVGVLTSGGVDSASVACLADRAVGAGTQGRDLFLYSAVYERSPGAETSAYQEMVFRACPSATPRAVVGDDWWALRESAETAVPLDEPPIEYGEETAGPLLAAAREDGCGIVLTGYGADQALCSHSYARPWMLDDVRLGDLPRELGRFLGRGGAAGAPLLALAAMQRSLPRRWVASGFRRVRRRRSGLGDPRLRCAGLPGHPAELTACSLLEGLGAARAATLEYQAWRAGVEVRHPFLDRRVVELLIHLPRGLRFRAGVRKWILRQAVDGLVPEPVRTRSDLAHFGRLISRGFREREGARLASWMEDAEVRRRRLLSPRDLGARWRDHLAAARQAPVARPMVVLGYVEKWLRQAPRPLRP